MFAGKYQEMHRLHREADGTVTLYIGAENWPFPIPLLRENGAWRFDSVTGMKEVLFRRIGENELTAIAACHDSAAAAMDDRTKPSDATGGKRPRGFGSEGVQRTRRWSRTFPRLLLSRITNAANQGTHRGFGVIAYPAEYRSSGVMTFIVTDRGVVYEKDLGAKTTSIATGMTAFHKDRTWRTAGD